MNKKEIIKEDINNIKPQKSTNLIIKDTEIKIINSLNDAKLPITIIQMILNEVKKIIDKNADKLLENERIQYEDALNKYNEQKNKKEGVTK